MDLAENPAAAGNGACTGAGCVGRRGRSLVVRAFRAPAVRAKWLGKLGYLNPPLDTFHSFVSWLSAPHALYVLPHAVLFWAALVESAAFDADMLLQST